jgi:hypothetical protein
MPDASAAAASHDIVQMLFYFICILGAAIGGGLIWLAKAVIIPLKDAGIDYLKNQVSQATAVRETLTEVAAIREKYFERLASIDKSLAEIKKEINCPPN